MAELLAPHEMLCPGECLLALPGGSRHFIWLYFKGNPWAWGFMGKGHHLGDTHSCRIPSETGSALTHVSPPACWCWQMTKIKRFSNDSDVLYPRADSPFMGGGAQCLTCSRALFLGALGQWELYGGVRETRQKQGKVGPPCLGWPTFPWEGKLARVESEDWLVMLCFFGRKAFPLSAPDLGLDLWRGPGHWGGLCSVGPDPQMTFISARTATNPCSHITAGSKAEASPGTDGGHWAKGPPPQSMREVLGGGGRVEAGWFDFVSTGTFFGSLSLTSLHISKQHSFMNKHQDIKYFHTLC